MRLRAWVLPWLVILELLSLAIGLMPPRLERSRSSAPVIQDLSKQEVELNVVPERILADAPIIAPYLSIDQGPGHVIAAARFTLDMARRSLLACVYPAISNVMTSGEASIPNVEQVLKWKPSYLFTSSVFASYFRNAGVQRVVAIDDGRALVEDDISKIWQLIGVISGNDDRTQILMAKFRARTDHLHSIITAVPHQLIRIVILLKRSNAWAIVGQTSYLNRFISTAGGRNLATQATFSDSSNFEQLLLLNPDLILIVAPVDPAATAQIYDEPRWQAIRAVRNKLVYLMPLHLGYNMPIDDPLLLAWMMEIFHPATMPHVTRDLYRSTYRDTFDYELSDNELDETLHLRENSQSFGYTRFIATETIKSPNAHTCLTQQESPIK